MHHRRTWLLVFSLLLILTTVRRHAAAGSRAPDGPPDFTGDWEEFFLVHPDSLDALRSLGHPFWYQGELLTIGVRSQKRSTMVHLENGDDPAAARLLVRRNGRWQPLPGAPAGGSSVMTRSGDRLLMVGGKRILVYGTEGWTAFEGERLSEVNAIAFWHGVPVAGGHSLLNESGRIARLARWSDEGWYALGGDVSGAEPEVAALLEAGESLWVAGAFSRAGDLPCNNIAVFDGDLWHDLGGGVDAPVTALVAWNGGVVVAGAFSRAGDLEGADLVMWREGRWQPVAPLPLKPPVVRTPDRCPEARVRQLAVWNGKLVARGSFGFEDADGRQASGAAVLTDRGWRALPGCEAWGDPEPPTQLSASRGWLTEEPEFVPDYYEPREWRRSHWRLTTIAADDSMLAVGGRRWLAVVDEHGSRILESPQDASDQPCKVVDLDGEVYGLGSRYVRGERVEGLARLTPIGWRPVGDWLGTRGDSGGDVETVARWRGDLIAAGRIDRIADQVVRHVARFDGEHWQPLGRGIPFPTVNQPFIVPREHDLVVFAGISPHVHDWGNFANCWLWDGRFWTRVVLPPETTLLRNDWMLAAVGDTLWAVTDRRVPREHPTKPAPDGRQGLYCLVDTTWCQFATWDEPFVRQIVHWRGAIHALATFGGRQGVRLLRWTGEDWERIGGRDLPPIGGLVAAGEHLLVSGADYSLAWDGKDWSIWPGLPDESMLDELTWFRGRLVGSSDHRHGDMRAWSGPLPPPQNSRWLPEEPVIPPYREPADRPCPDLLPLLATERGDTFTGWWFHDEGGYEPEPIIQALGFRRMEFRFETTSRLMYRFTPRRGSWIVVTGGLKGDGRHTLPLPHVGVKWPDPEGWKGYARQSVGWSEYSGEPMDLQLVLPVPDRADLSGWLSIGGHGDEGTFYTRDLRIEMVDDYPRRYLTDLWRELLAIWRAPVDAVRPPATELPPGVAARVDTVATLAELDDLAELLVTAVPDDRIRIHGHLDSGAWDDLAPPPPYSLPVFADPCAGGGRQNSSWLVDDIRYTADPNRSSGHKPVDGRILDLRNPRPDAAETVLILDRWLNYGRAGSHRWARSHRVDGKRGKWYRLGRDDRVDSRPLVVLISPDTRGDLALLAEMLGRLDHVTLLGETTAPLPPMMAGIAVDVGPDYDEWTIYIPAGTWEAPDGRTLTDTRLAPDIPWPADDTEGLIIKARAIIEVSRAAAPTPR